MPPTPWIRITTLAGTVLFLVCQVSAVEITQQFPAAGSMRTQWRVVWDIENHAGGSQILYIKEASFKRGPSEAEVKVLGDCRLAEIFVPYNSGVRIYDLSAHHFSLVTLDKSALGPSCVAAGRLFSQDGTQGNTGLVAAEVHDGHIRWMNDSETVRRAQSLALWSVLNGANYRYIMLYKFRDDGVIDLELGATAHNLYSDDSDSKTHLHMACWRINLELGDATHTDIGVVRFDTAAAATHLDAIGQEARIKWNPEEFTRLRVTSSVNQNSHNPQHPISYELIPMRIGSGRFSGVGEEFTQHDLWVTKSRNSELRPRDLDANTNGEALAGSAVTLWHSAAVLHVPRDEDFGVNGTESHEGVAITTWAGCELKPRNFFASTPLYP